jgi:excinuclease UvrABC helicase subunit UvrB
MSWNYKKADWIGMNLFLMKSIILHEIRNARSVNDAATLLQVKIKEAMVKFIPRIRHRRKQDEQWVSRELKEQFIVKRVAYPLWKNQPNGENLSRHKKAAEKLRKEIFLSKKQYFR